MNEQSFGIQETDIKIDSHLNHMNNTFKTKHTFSSSMHTHRETQTHKHSDISHAYLDTMR